jgi:hypothetical protein
MHKRLCACGCGERVTRKVESQHMSALAPAVLASQVLDQNRKMVRRKKKSKAVGFPAPLCQRLAMGNNAGIDDMDVDDNDSISESFEPMQTAEDHPVSLDSSGSMMMGEDFDEAYGHSRLRRSGWIASHVEDSKLFRNISHISKLIRIFI